MQLLNLPVCNAKVIEKDQKRFILDKLRKKYVALTPEEWVRQHFVFYLISHKNYPESLVANEIALKLNGTSKRCDTVVYDSYLQPLVIVEYKAPSITINQQVFDQIVRYNMCLKVKYLIISNGINHYCCQINYETNSYIFLKEIPDYQEIIEE